tara:strand:- start:6314 stop:7468 length:1155 start_codon:yes stop_codon:yes gene_type:complete
MKNFKPCYYLIALSILLVNCSKDETIETIENTNPGPFSVSILETRMDGANIGWTQSVDNDNDTVTYSIYLNNQRVSNGGSALVFNFTNLNPETNYEGHIIAEDGKGGTKQVNFAFKTEPDIEEENIDNPDLELIGGQGAFTITPGSGIMSGETSVNLKIIFDDLKIQIPNDSLDYRIEWKTNGAYGSFENEGNEADILDLDGIIYTSINTETTTGEEKFRATLYTRPKGSNETFTLKGSAITSLSILNEPNKKYFVLTPIYTVTFLANEPCTAGASDVRNLLDNAIYVNEVANAKSYSLKITEIVSGPSKYDLWDTKTAPDLFYSWNQGNTSYLNTNTDPAVSNAAFTFSLASSGINTCNPDYSDSVGWISGTRGIGQLTVTLE